VGIEVAVEVGGKRVKTTTKNVSLTGILLSGNFSFPVNSICRLIFNLSPMVQFAIKGKIVRCNGESSAITFLEMDEEAFGHIKRLVAYNVGNADVIEKELPGPGFENIKPPLR